MSKLVYLFDGLSPHNELTTNYNGSWICQESPLEPGVYLIPVASTEVEPPVFDGSVDMCNWNGTQWVLTPIPKLAPPVMQTGHASANQPTTTGIQTL